MIYLPKNAVRDDKLESVISYSDIIKIVKKSMTSCSCNLIEKAAENIAEALFKSFRGISKLEIILKKPEAPIFESFDYVGIKITRKRSDFID